VINYLKETSIEKINFVGGLLSALTVLSLNCKDNYFLKQYFWGTTSSIMRICKNICGEKSAQTAKIISGKSSLETDVVSRYQMAKMVLLPRDW